MIIKLNEFCGITYPDKQIRVKLFTSEQRWAQHAQMAKLLHDGLAKMGLELYCPNPNDRLPTVTTIKIPDGFQWAKVNGYLMEKYALEIAGGLGPSAGKVINSLIGTTDNTASR